MFVIVAIMANHGLIRLKRFISWFTTKLCNSFFHLYLMLHACIKRIDVMSEKFLGKELNKALIEGCAITITPSLWTWKDAEWILIPSVWSANVSMKTGLTCFSNASLCKRYIWCLFGLNQVCEMLATKQSTRDVIEAVLVMKEDQKLKCC